MVIKKTKLKLMIIKKNEIKTMMAINKTKNGIKNENQNIDGHQKKRN